MAEFNVRSDSVDVEQIMEQIRARIREKRGVDYTEQQIRELAAVKLEKFLDPRGVRSDLLEQFRRAQPAYAPPELPNYAFESETMFASTRAPLRWIRKLLNPILKLFFNPNPLIQALNIQSRLNTMYGEREGRRESTRRAFDQLQYELMHNLVIETTRMSIEVKNLKMRVESLASRLEFNERRSRALESVVAYKPSADTASEPTATLNAGRPVPVQESAPRPDPARSSGTGQPWTPREHQGRSDAGRGATHPNQASAAGGQAAPPPRDPLAPQEPGRPIPIQPGATTQGPSAVPAAGEGPGQRSRRRRRRRGRRGGAPAAAIMGAIMGGGVTAADSPIVEFDSPESIAEGAAEADVEPSVASLDPPVEAPRAAAMPDDHSPAPSASTSTQPKAEDHHEPQPPGDPHDHSEAAGGTTVPEQSDPQ